MIQGKNKSVSYNVPSVTRAQHAYFIQESDQEPNEENLRETIEKSFKRVVKFIKERGYVYVRYNIERRRALIKFGKNPGDTTLGALAIEDIAFKDGKWLGDFRVYEYTVEDFTVEDLVQLSNLVFTERVSRAMSRGYLRINGRVVKGYGIKPINEDLESLLRKMFSEVYGSNQVISV